MAPRAPVVAFAAANRDPTATSQAPDRTSSSSRSARRRDAGRPHRRDRKRRIPARALPGSRRRCPPGALDSPRTRRLLLRVPATSAVRVGRPVVDDEHVRVGQPVAELVEDPRAGSPPCSRRGRRRRCRRVRRGHVRARREDRSLAVGPTRSGFVLASQRQLRHERRRQCRVSTRSRMRSTRSWRRLGGRAARDRIHLHRGADPASRRSRSSTSPTCRPTFAAR